MYEYAAHPLEKMFQANMSDQRAKLHDVSMNRIIIQMETDVIICVMNCIAHVIIIIVAVIRIK